MTFETDSLESLEEPVESSVVLDIIRKHVFVGGTSTRTMDAQETWVVLKETANGELIQKGDSSLTCGVIGPGGVELVPRPERGFAGQLVEIHRLRATGEIMIAEKHQRALLLNDVDARQWVRPVSDDVTQTDDLIDGTGFNLGHHRTEGDGIRMDVTDDRDTH